MRPLGEKPLDAEKDFDELVDFLSLLHVDHVTGPSDEMHADRRRHAINMSSRYNSVALAPDYLKRHGELGQTRRQVRHLTPTCEDRTRYSV